MILLGIIKNDVIVNNQVTVRIPSFEGAGNKNEYVCQCSIDVQPGINPNYKIGDIVYVSFVGKGLSESFIIGKFYKAGEESIGGKISADILNIVSQANLPETTNIGDISGTDLKRALEQIEIINRQIKILADSSGGGSSYTAGEAIDITNNVIGVKHDNTLSLTTNNELSVNSSIIPDIQVVDMNGLLLSTTAAESTDTTVLNAIKALDVSKPIMLKNFNKRGNFSKDIDYTTTSYQTFFYKQGTHYYQVLRIFNYRNSSIKIRTFDTWFLNRFDSHIGEVIPQNSETDDSLWTVDCGTSMPDFYNWLTIGYSVGTSTYTNTMTANIDREQSLQKYTAYVDIGVNNHNGGNIYLYGSLSESSDYFKLWVTYNEYNTKFHYQLIDQSSLNKTSIDMGKFTFETSWKESTSDLGRRIAEQLISAPVDSPIELKNFRMLSTSNSSNNLVIVNGIERNPEEDWVFYALINYNQVLYRIQINAREVTPYLDYIAEEYKTTNVNFSGLYITETERTSTSSTLMSRLRDIISRNREYITDDYIYLPFTLYNFKWDSSSASRNNTAQARVTNVTSDSTKTTYLIIGNLGQRLNKRIIITFEDAIQGMGATSNVKYYYFNDYYAGTNGIWVDDINRQIRLRFSGGSAPTSDGLLKWNSTNQNISADITQYLPKVVTTTTYDQAYIKNGNGTQQMCDITPYSVGGSIMQRDSDGRSRVVSPTDSTHIANKDYVDTAIAAAVTTVLNSDF